MMLLALALASMAQQKEPVVSGIYTETLVAQQRPIPYPFLRESDVVWSTCLWKTIDLHERFNQFFYFPNDEFLNYGKKSLAYILWDAMAADEIPIYEDDDLKVPLDNQVFVRRYTKPDTILLEIGYDDDDNEIYQTVIRPKFFDGSEVYRYGLREVWFIGRQDSRMDSRRLALAPMKEVYRQVSGSAEEIYLGMLPLFWVPMQNPQVRNLLARYNAYVDDNNLVNQPSWDNIFVSQRYSAYTTRESNIYDRSITDYITGEDALFEAAIIEEKVHEMENEMWEY